METVCSTLTTDTINQNLRHMEFPWPSPVVSLGNEIEKEIKKVYESNEYTLITINCILLIDSLKCLM